MAFYLGIPSRNEFGGLLNSRNLRGEAAEVGFHRGVFASEFMKTWQGKTLHGIDHWAIPMGYEPQAATLPDRGLTREDDYTAARFIAAGHGGRIKLHRMDSDTAVRKFQDDSLDFVYLDGDHRRQAVYGDCVRWLTKVKPGGILAGHDWLCPGESPGKDWGPEIQPAVHDFLAVADLHCYLIPEPGFPWSWYVVKEKR